MQGSGQPLPYLDQIQASFGHHDVSAITAHVDDRAASAAKAIGAEAYATGNHVAFRGPPSLHTAAHEAAHTIQQRQGVQFKGGFGESSDRYEQQADRAADAVVRGESAQALLGRATNQSKTGDSASTQNVQRKPATDAATLSQANDESTQSDFQMFTEPGDWFVDHQDRLLRELRAKIVKINLTRLPPGVSFRGGDSTSFLTAIAAQLRGSWTEIASLMAPTSLFDAIQRGRQVLKGRTQGDPDWSPEISYGIRTAITQTLLASLPRMASRYGALSLARNTVADQNNPPPPVNVALIPRTHPMDAYVSRAMVGKLLFNVKTFQAGAFVGPLRPVTLKLRFDPPAFDQTWVEIAHPKDATREEVAQELYGTQYKAYLLSGTAPMYIAPRQQSFDQPMPQDYRFAPKYEGSTRAITPQPTFRPPLSSAASTNWPPSPPPNTDAHVASGGPQPQSLTLSGNNDEFTAGEVSQYSAAFPAPRFGTQFALQSPPPATLGSTAVANERAVESQAAAAKPVNDPTAAALANRYSAAAQLTHQIRNNIFKLATAARRPYIRIDHRGTGEMQPAAPGTKVALARIEGFRQQIIARAASLKKETTPDKLALWNAQARAQLATLSEIATASSYAVSQIAVYASWPGASKAISNVAFLFVKAALQSDLAQTGAELARQANRRLAMLPIVLMENLLAQLRKTIAHVHTNKSGVGGESKRESYGLDKVEVQEQAIREKIAYLREVLLQNPEAAQAMLKQVLAELGELETGVSVLFNMDQIDAAWRQLYDSLSFAGQIRATWGGGNDLLKEKMDSGHKLNREWHAIYLEWKYGDKDKAQQQLKEKSSSKRWRRYLRDVQDVVREHQKNDHITEFAAMVGIAIATGGAGAALELGVAGTILFEAGAFTAMSYFFVDNDPSITGAVKHFAHNLAMFGMLRGVSQAYTALLGIRAASAGGKLGLVVTQFVALNATALATAQLEKKHTTGEALSQDEILKISKDTFYFLVAVSIGSFLTRAGIRKMRFRGEPGKTMQRADNLYQQVTELRLRVEASRGKDHKAAELLLEAQKAHLEAEILRLEQLREYAANPHKARADGLTQKQINQITTRAEGIATSLEQAYTTRLMADLTHVGGNSFQVPPQSYQSVAAMFRSQGARVVEVVDPISQVAVTDPITGGRQMHVFPTSPTAVPRPGIHPGAGFTITEQIGPARPAGTNLPKGQTSDFLSQLDPPAQPARRLRRYDPSVRSETELQIDRDPTPRRFETTKRASLRANLAEAEIQKRLGQKPHAQIELHNHLLGIPGIDYFVTRIGHGDALRTFEIAYQVAKDTPAIRQGTPDVWNAAQTAKSQLASMKDAPLEVRLDVAKNALRKMLRAGKDTPFDQPYELRDELIKRYIDKNANTYQNFTADAMRELARDGIRYSEQSVSVNKLNKRLPEGMVTKIREGLNREGLDTDLRFLAMVNTKVLAEGSPGTKASQGWLAKNRATLQKILSRKDVMGIDVADAESFVFTEAGRANFKELYSMLKLASLQRGRPLVFRPHVGEGYVPKSGPAPQLSHVEVARKNLQALIDTLTEMGYSPAMAKADGVIIRFGHATHATPAQVKTMAELGVIIEANIGSNKATGSIGTLQEHPLLYQLYYGAKTVLSTDGHGVMNTNLTKEYQRASEILQEFAKNEKFLRIEGKEIRWSDLSTAQKHRFTIKQLKQWAAEYGDNVRSGDRVSVKGAKQ